MSRIGNSPVSFSEGTTVSLVDDIVTVIGEVTKKHETTKMITVKTEIYNQNNICLINGIGKVIVRD